MTLGEQLEEANQKIQKLRGELSGLTKKKAPLFDVNNIEEAEAAISTLRSSISDVRKKVDEANEGFVDIENSLKKVNA